MMRRLIAPTVVLCACLALGACSSFSGFVADSWPTWAGGMPKDVPPRPGAPGYEEFIAHQQAKDAAAAATAGQSAAGAQPITTATVPPATPVTAAPATPAPASAQVQPPLPPAYRRTDDQGVVQGGGLY